jgi:hypothetical protein
VKTILDFFLQSYELLWLQIAGYPAIFNIWYLTGYPASQIWFPAGYHISQKAGLSGRISGASLVNPSTPVPGSLDKKCGRTFCLIKDATFFPFYCLTNPA